MVYAAIAIASIAVSLSIYVYSDHALLTESNSGVGEVFTTSIEAHMIYYRSTFYVVIPSNACQLVRNIPGSVHINSKLCNSNGMVEVSLSRNLNGSYMLSGG